MDIAKDGYVPRGSEFEFLRLSAGSGAEIVPKLLIPRDIWPEDVVRNRVAVLKFNRGSLLDYHQCWNEFQATLVDGDRSVRGRERLSRDRFQDNGRWATALDDSAQFFRDSKG